MSAFRPPLKKKGDRFNIATVPEPLHLVNGLTDFFRKVYPDYISKEPGEDVYRYVETEQM